MKKDQKFEVAEPTAVYEVMPIECNEGKVPSREELYESYVKYKAEADAIYGKKKRMTVEEYFGKLRYMINRYYESVQSQD